MSEFDLDKVLKLLHHANQQGINIAFENEELSVRFQKGKNIEKKFLDELKSNKPFLVHYFKTHASNGNASNRLRLQKIDRDGIEEIPLSFAQERLWFIDKLEGSVQYHIPAVLQLRGQLNIEALSYAIQQIINRHEVLRTVIQEKDGKASQYINAEDGWQLNTEDGTAYLNDDAGLQRYIQQLIEQPFDLSKDYMIRANLLTLSGQVHVLVVTLHHIASDGWSTAIMVRELVELYNSFEKGRKNILPPLDIQYADFAAWQRKYLQGELLDQKLAYWKNKLQGVETLQLPIDYDRPLIQSTKGDAINFDIDKGLAEQLLQLCQQQGTTLFMTLLAAFNVLLNRYSGQDDICVGTPIAGRDQQEAEALIGFFINSLALRNDLGKDMSFADFLKEVKTTTLEAYDHKELPFEKVVEAVVAERNLSRSPIFQVMFILQNLPPVPQLKLGEVELAQLNFDNFTSKYDLAFVIVETGNGLQGTIRYCTDLFKEATIVRLSNHFKNLLAGIVKDPQQRIRLLPMISPEEQYQLLGAFNDTSADYPKNKTILDLFTAQVLAASSAPAVVFGNENLSYSQLDERSNQLAHFLQAKGVTEGALVALGIDRSIEMIVGIIGILKAGAAYVPIDISYPPERIQFMLEDTAVEIMLTADAVQERISASGQLQKICLDTQWDEINSYSGTDVQTSIDTNSKAYIIYTSGSTGKPKGVIVGHGGVVNLAFNQAAALRLTPKTTTLQFASIGFDASCYEIFNTLLSGGRLVISKKEDLLTAESFETCINNNQVDLAVLPPSFLHVVKDSLGCLKTIVSAGEALKAGIARDIQSKGIRLINAYGPTENTVCTSLTDEPVLKNDLVVIGKPIANVQVCIMNQFNQLSPVGVPGELCIGGSQLAQGYLNRPDLTAEKFIINPFDTSGHSKLYRSGDLTRWLPDGNIEYLGRIDDQVKLRGYRIELGEIENSVLQSGLASEAVVLLREDTPGNRRLVSYVVPAAAYDREVLTAYLEARLPDYMIPSVWVKIERLPITPNGKVDRKALPVPEVDIALQKSYVAPRNEIETQLATVWKELLHVQQVGIHDNFFELGGDSILIIQVVSRCRRLGLELQPKDLFMHQTIGRLAVAIAEQSASVVYGEQGILTGQSGLLPIQQWYLGSEPTDISFFNQGVILGVAKTVTKAMLQEAVSRLLEHHDALRFRYSRNEENKWQQEYGIDIETIVEKDLQQVALEQLSTYIETITTEYQRSLNITAGKLVRVVWMQTPVEESKNRLLIIIHHLAVDGVSWRILLSDLELLLTGLIESKHESLGVKSSSYRQWYEILKQHGTSRKLLSQLPYWEHISKTYSPLPVDINFAGPIKDQDTRRYNLRLDATRTNQLLQEVPRVYHTEINDILLATLAATLCEWSGREQINIGLEGHGREDISGNVDISRTVGWFTILYPLRLSVAGTIDNGGLIKSIKEQLRKLPGKGLGYGVLKYINQEKSLEGPQPWDVLFNYLGQLDTVVRDSKIFSGVPESQGQGRSGEQEVLEKLSLNSSVRGGELTLNWTYSAKHYEEGTIEKLSDFYLSKLEQLIAHCVEEQSETSGSYTPSDYGLGDEIDYKDLDQFLSETVNGKPRKEQIAGLYRLSGLQHGMLFHGLYEVGIGAYIEQFACDLVGVNIDLLQKSWMQLIGQHTILRSAFYVDAFSVPVQCVYKEVTLPITLLDYREMDAETQGSAIKAYYQDDKNKGFDFAAAPLMRLAIFRLTEDHYRMLWTSHHILFDGWSFPILMEEFLTTYELLNAGETLPLQEEDRYEDYIRYIERSDKEAEEKYWRNYLQGIEQNTLLPFIPTTIDRNKGKGEYKAIGIQIKSEIAAKIQSFAHQHRVTLNTIMQCVWAYLLHRYTGNKNIVYGIIVSGRPDDLAGVEHRVGMYINTLPLYSGLKEETEISEWLQLMQAQQVTSRQFQHTPFTVVQGWSGIQGDLFDTLLTFENYPFNKVVAKKQWALSVGNIDVQDHTNYPLSIIIGSAEQINIRFSYNTLLLEETYVQQIRNHFEHVLMQLIDKGDKKISDISLLTSAERHQILNEFNEGAVAVSNGTTLAALFSLQAAKTPQATALVFRDQQLTYQQLDEQSNQLAHYLLSKKLGEGALIPVCISRCIDMVTAILGILKAGAAYVPIDPEYPSERISFILEDTGATLLITNQESSSQLKSFASANMEVLELDGDAGITKSFPLSSPGIEIKISQPAYVIYTSGSTGRPKGVMVDHGNLMHYLVNNKTHYIGNDIATAGSYIHLSYTFDASLTAMLMPLLAGKLSVIASKQSVDVFEDENLLKYAPYDFIKITPAHLELIHPVIKEFGPGLLTSRLVIGGEALHPGQFDSFINDHLDVTIVNEYGPTEATVGCTVFDFKVISQQDLIKNGIPIGKPIDNASIYILDESQRLLPIGVKGEICIGGPGVANGYLNRPELTDEKFVTDPFASQPGGRMYKTGDIGRWLPDGNIEYLGRIDDQVKIRGYRIEPGEVEQVLQSQECVTQGVVLAKADKDGGKRLVGYYVPERSAVKARESELQLQRVASWKELYEVEYGQTEKDENIDPEFNIIGWNDSFSGDPIPADQMKMWLDDIVSDVLIDKPARVLEIGCGTGLIYYQLAGKVEKYIGCDLSKSSINQIRDQIDKGQREYGETQLFTAPAHEVNLDKGEQVDTILLNSMVQYFPGEDYIDSVIEKCMQLLNGEGRIIIGDVRDNRLLELFKARLRLQKLQDSIPVKEFKWGIEQDLIKEEELCFSPAYFYRLKDVYPAITHIDIQWKQGDFLNELSLYRYTVVIYVGVTKEVLEPHWQSWDAIPDKSNLFTNNGHKAGSLIALKDVPNPRLWKEQLLHEALKNNTYKTVGEILPLLDTPSNESNQIMQVLKLATEQGYHYRWLIHEDPLKANLLLEKSPSGKLMQSPSAYNIYTGNAELTNIPLFTDISYLLQKDIRESMQVSLPEYMLPSELNALRQLPLTGNGKVDRAFLSQREDRVFVNTLNYLPPTTSTEIAIAEIWKELLHLERVGIEDDFFDLGGHSLLAMRVIAAVRKTLQVELNIKDLFIHPTIGLLAGHIQQQSKGILFPAIEAVIPKPAKIPLSFGQERLWFIDQLEGSTQYHIPATLRLKGNLDVAALSNALQQIIGRHEVLRTVIRAEAGQGYQEVKEKDGWELVTIDGPDDKEDAKEISLLIRQLLDKPFNLAKDYMLRATLVKIDETDHILVAILHHIASDGWSTSIMVHELAELYNAIIEKRTPVLPLLPVQYADFAIWQRKYLQGEAWNKKLDYWKNKLDGTAPLHLPVDFPRPLIQSTNGAIASVHFEKELSDQLQGFSQQHGTTLFMTLVAAFKVLLYRYTEQEDICVGTPIAGRQQQEVEGLIGFFINTLALRSELHGNKPFQELLYEVKNTTLEAYEHQEVPFEKIVELVVKERDMSRSPLFQVMLALQNTPAVEELRLGDLQLSRGSVSADHHSSRFEISFIITDTGRGLSLTVEYCTDLFTEQFILRLTTHFKTLLYSILKAPHQSIGILPMLDEGEKNNLLTKLNDTYLNFPADTTVLNLFAAQVSKNPGANALISGEAVMSYRELDERSNLLAAYLIDKGVVSETMVPVVMARSISMITAMLAIMKAGGAYVPIDPEYPIERIAYMISDIGASIIVTDLPVDEMPGATNIQVVDPSDEAIYSHSASLSFRQNCIVSPFQLAYVIFTSGSTGKPKGVMIEHKGLANLVHWHIEAFNLQPASRGTVMAGVGFDAFGWEIWPYLSSGASLYVVDEQTRLVPSSLLTFFIDHKITHSFVATALIPDFIYKSANKNICLQYLLTGGDKLPSVDTSELSFQLINNYGPTENTVVTTSYTLPKTNKNTIPAIGKPISNTLIYLLNQHEQLVPAGVAGELCVGGTGVARGYLNLSELTKEKFIPDPFNNKPDARIYKTGDLVKLLPDGNLEYLGRRDEQVKIRGYRIETGEIEKVVQDSGLVQQVIVQARGSDANKKLAAYIVAVGNFKKDQLIDYLKKKIPDYMIPALWIQMEQFPLTHNGKINLKALPDPQLSATINSEYQAPVSLLEIQLVEIWKELLGIERIGVKDNFFELGGHSLLAMRMVAYIEKMMLISVPIKVLFQFTCISDLAKYLEVQDSTLPATENIETYKLFDV